MIVIGQTCKTRGTNPRTKKVLKQGVSLWSLIKGALADSPTNEQVVNAVKRVAEANDINIPEWGVNNGTGDSRRLLAGSIIDISSLDGLLKR